MLHVHFGLESLTPAELRRSLETAKALGRPVVYTVHDLENPQLADQRPYRELLETIVPAADHVLTLTPGAAAEIAARWGRQSRVVPHPTLLGGERGARDIGGAHDDVIRVGIHLRDLRPNIAAEPVVSAAVQAASLLRDAQHAVDFDVLLNDRDRDAATAARVVDAAAAHPSVRVRRTERLSDTEIEDWISGLDLFVLPYLHGTHSGWVELCYDLGVPVAGSDVGYIRDQHPAEFFSIDLHDARTLAAAVAEAGAVRSSRPVRAARLAQRRSERLAERDAVRAAHVEVYARAQVRS